MTANIKKRRILLKLSGEALGGENHFGIDPAVLESIAKEVHKAHKNGFEIGMVVGGGNLFRGAQLATIGIDRSTGDQMGMLATIMNGLVMRDSFESFGTKTRLMSAVSVPGIADAFDHRTAKRYLSEGDVVIFVGGTGNPYFTTDTSACLRGIEIGAEIILKATKVDYVYDQDPSKHKDAKPYQDLSYQEVLDQKLGVMDMTAITLAMEHQKPIRVFGMKDPEKLSQALKGETGTLIH